jgi:hypothetical protein
MVDQEYQTSDAEGRKMCAFVREKLAAVPPALDQGDADGAWIQLFGAATLCAKFKAHAEHSRRVIARLNAALT